MFRNGLKRNAKRKKKKPKKNRFSVYLEYVMYEN